MQVFPLSLGFCHSNIIWLLSSNPQENREMYPIYQFCPERPPCQVFTSLPDENIFWSLWMDVEFELLDSTTPLPQPVCEAVTPPPTPPPCILSLHRHNAGRQPIKSPVGKLGPKKRTPIFWLLASWEDQPFLGSSETFHILDWHVRYMFLVLIFMHLWWPSQQSIFIPTLSKHIFYGCLTFFSVSAGGGDLQNLNEISASSFLPLSVADDKLRVNHHQHCLEHHS